MCSNLISFGASGINFLARAANSICSFEDRSIKPLKAAKVSLVANSAISPLVMSATSAIASSISTARSFLPVSIKAGETVFGIFSIPVTQQE